MNPIIPHTRSWLISVWIVLWGAFGFTAFHYNSTFSGKDAPQPTTEREYFEQNFFSKFAGAADYGIIRPTKDTTAWWFGWNKEESRWFIRYYFLATISIIFLVTILAGANEIGEWIRGERVTLPNRDTSSGSGGSQTTTSNPQTQTPPQTSGTTPPAPGIREYIAVEGLGKIFDVLLHIFFDQRRR